MYTLVCDYSDCDGVQSSSYSVAKLDDRFPDIYVGKSANGDISVDIATISLGGLSAKEIGHLIARYETAKEACEIIENIINGGKDHEIRN